MELQTILINATALLLAFLAMEFVAWFMHKYVMHGFLWFLHKDHHQRDITSNFEKNDYFFIIFAIPGISCLYIGMDNFTVPFWVGAGITLYGAAYFFIHDLFIHQRVKVLTKTNSPYLKGIRRAHKVHHKTLGKHGAKCFGMLWVPLHYFEAVKKTAK